jgi:hypothetical protein
MLVYSGSHFRFQAAHGRLHSPHPATLPPHQHLAKSLIVRIFPILLAGALCLSAAAITTTTQNPEASAPQETPVKPMTIAESYHAFAAAGDDQGLIELWKANEYRVLPVIDQDLEGSLSIWESAPDAEGTPAAMDALVERALFGARAATAAFGRPIFLDYAASFASWNDAEKRNFRAGQAAYGDSRKATEAGDNEAAVAAGERCTELALPLGDWWGTGMGLGASGSAKLELGDHKGALSDLSRARLINNGLGLRRSELSNLAGMLTCLIELGHTPRAISVCRELVVATEGQENLDYVAQLMRLKAK